MMKLRLQSDYVLVELEPARETLRNGLFRPGPDPVRIARVLATGPGRFDKKGRRVKMQLKAGDRFPFFMAVTETKMGRSLAKALPDSVSILRESDVLFVIENGADIEVTV